MVTDDEDEGVAQQLTGRVGMYECPLYDLPCAGPRCGAVIEASSSESEGDLAREAAAHGWRVVGDDVYCPRCAAEIT